MSSATPWPQHTAQGSKTRPPLCSLTTFFQLKARHPSARLVEFLSLQFLLLLLVRMFGDFFVCGFRSDSSFNCRCVCVTQNEPIDGRLPLIISSAIWVNPHVSFIRKFFMQILGPFHSLVIRLLFASIPVLRRIIASSRKVNCVRCECVDVRRLIYSFEMVESRSS